MTVKALFKQTKAMSNSTFVHMEQRLEIYIYIFGKVVGKKITFAVFCSPLVRNEYSCNCIGTDTNKL